jgi:hypothetical protein
MTLTDNDIREINKKVREMLPLPEGHEKMCAHRLSKFFARREFEKMQLIKIKKKEYETVQGL